MYDGFRPHYDDRAPQDTQREVTYLRHLVASRAPVTVKLKSGETVGGFVEYYDDRFIRLTRADGPNLFIFKHDIKYLYENQPAPEARGGPVTPS